MEPLYVYIFKHEGVWPVGACSVVMAEDANDAMRRIKDLLAPRGFGDIELVWCSADTDAKDTIILDGDY